MEISDNLNLIFRIEDEIIRQMKISGKKRSTYLIEYPFNRGNNVVQAMTCAFSLKEAKERAGMGYVRKYSDNDYYGDGQIYLFI